MAITRSPRWASRRASGESPQPGIQTARELCDLSSEASSGSCSTRMLPASSSSASRLRLCQVEIVVGVPAREVVPVFRHPHFTVFRHATPPAAERQSSADGGAK